MLAGGNRVGTPEPAVPAAGSTFSGLVSEARPDVRGPSTRKRAWALGVGAAALAGLALILVARASGGRGTAAAVPTPGSNVVAALPQNAEDRRHRRRGSAAGSLRHGGRQRRTSADPVASRRRTAHARLSGRHSEPMVKTLDGTKSRTLVLGMRPTLSPLRPSRRCLVAPTRRQNRPRRIARRVATPRAASAATRRTFSSISDLAGFHSGSAGRFPIGYTQQSTGPLGNV